MGAKVGRCVYWPHSGIICPDPELLDIGNNVVFGFQPHLITTDRYGSGKIVIEDGGKFQSYSDFVIVLTVSVLIASAMVADRVVLLPGTRVGSGAVMGTGSLGKRNGNYTAGSIWIGNS
jgi:acetyltransferase-like isoleucine patch superfamily enzyme